MEWSAPGIVLSTAPYGESGAVVHVLTQEHGPYRGLVRGGQGRRQAALWQTGNLVALRWTARLAEQLGAMTGEPIHATAARVLDAPDALAMVSSCCALADGAMVEREPQPGVFDGLLSLLARLSLNPAQAPRCRADLLRWEIALLGALGFGLDLSRCAVTGARADLAYVSPRTARAVSSGAAAEWAARLLPLPACMLTEPSPDGSSIAQEEVGDPDWAAGLRLTGHFLERDVFGSRHRPLPAARQRLSERAGYAEKRTIGDA